MKKGFTLAEVLITIAIIGIVAMLTVPILLQNYKRQVATTRLKKFYNTMQQVISLSEIENKSIKTWQRAGYHILDEEGAYDYDVNAQVCYDFFKKYLAPYMSYLKAVPTPEKESDIDEVSVYLADGSLVTLHNGDCVDLHYDINGDAAPNEFGRDTFTFAICERITSRGHTGGKAFGALGYMRADVGLNRDAALESCKLKPFYCGALLMFDNWEFKDDYPIKF